MMKKQTDPFTRTPGIAGQAYIDNGIADEIIANFNNHSAAKYVYKITGLRGSGKSVEYSKVIRTLKDTPGWLVYPLSASGDVINTLIAKLSMEDFADSKDIATSLSSNSTISGNAAIVSGSETINITKTIRNNPNYYSNEAALTKMISLANKAGYNVLIGIDDISKTAETTKFLSIFGSMLLEGLSVYLIVTGLSENIEDFSNEKNLSFFKRADAHEIKALNKYDITYMYEKLLSVSEKEAKELEEISGGYAYAYQVLGSLYFNKKPEDTIKNILPDFDRILFRDSYDLIWKSLTNTEKDIIRILCKSKNGSAAEIKQQMNNPSTYPVYRNRLINKHLVNGDERGVLKITLPHFNKYVEIWGDE